MNTNGRQATTKQCASLDEELRRNSLIPPQFKPENDVIYNQIECQTPPIDLIWEYEGASFNYKDTQHPLEAHLHTNNHAGTNLDPKKAAKAPNITQNELEMHVF